MANLNYFKPSACPGISVGEVDSQLFHLSSAQAKLRTFCVSFQAHMYSRAGSYLEHVKKIVQSTSKYGVGTVISGFTAFPCLSQQL